MKFEEYSEYIASHILDRFGPFLQKTLLVLHLLLLYICISQLLVELISGFHEA